MFGGLDFNARMADLVGEVAGKVAEFRHVDPTRIRVSAAFNRSRARDGVLAYILPLRYRDGLPIEVRRHRGKVYHWAMFPQHRDGVEIFYYLYFMLPRFLNLPFREKLETVVHELYHIHPQFNGDLRRFKGRSPTHGNSREYDRRVREVTDHFLASEHNEDRYEFLRGGAHHLRLRYGEIHARHFPEPRPKLIKVISEETGFEFRDAVFPTLLAPEAAV